MAALSHQDAHMDLTIADRLADGRALPDGTPLYAGRRSRRQEHEYAVRRDLEQRANELEEFRLYTVTGAGLLLLMMVFGALAVGT